jgi:hypothetical protein
MNKVLLVLNIVLLVLFAVAFNGGFGPNPAEDRTITRNLKYVQDKRTQLCFAVSGFRGISGPIYTEVPCDKVADALSNPWSK